MISLSPVLACVTTSAESTTGEAPMTLLSPVPACVCDCLLFGVLVRFSVHVCVYVWCMRFLMFVSSFFYIVRSCVCQCGCMRVCVPAFCVFVCAFVMCSYVIRALPRALVCVVSCLPVVCFACRACAVRAWRAVHPIAGFVFLCCCVLVSAF